MRKQCPEMEAVTYIPLSKQAGKKNEKSMAACGSIL
jgi:hypothetical protein